MRPDLAGWRRDRLADPGEQRPITVPPDWVCEILSPSTAARDKVQKRALYASAGIQHDWLVDVDTRTVEVFALEGGRWMLDGSYDDTATVAIPPFEAVELEIGDCSCRTHDSSALWGAPRSSMRMRGVAGGVFEGGST